MEWLNLKQIVIKTGLSRDTAKRIIKSAKYKGSSLEFEYRKSERGQLEKVVLWNTNNSQADEIVPLDPKVLPQAVAVETGGSFLGDGSEEAAQTVENEKHTLLAPCASPFKKEEKDGEAKAEAGAVDFNLFPLFEGGSRSGAEAGGFALDLEREFSELLHRKTLSKTPEQRKALAHYYRKQFRAKGEIPAGLKELGDSRKKCSGRQSTLEADVTARFIEMVKTSADKKSGYFCTQATRKVTVFHYELEREFCEKIDIHKLYQVAKKHKLKKYFEKTDDEKDLTKPPSYFAAEPVGALVQMDGVEADYLAVRIGEGKFKKPTFIEFFDFGSRKLLAMHAYFSESNENSVDIFNRFLLGNSFAPVEMKIRPDNAKGFDNLKRCIKEINNNYAKKDGFSFTPDFARAGTPKDKAHLESSHRAFHRFEQRIINYYRERGKVIEQKESDAKVGNQMRVKTVTHIDITLEELNASGLIDEYMHQHNAKAHRFTEDGVQRRWKPDDRWDAHIAKFECFRFTELDAQKNRLYGYTKREATISKEGKITYDKHNYAVSDTALFSRVNSTKVKISVVGNGKLGIFALGEEGVYLGEALALRAPKKSQKVIELQEEKRERAVQGGVLKSIKDKFAAINLIEYSVERIERLIDQGLTEELTAQIIESEPKIKHGDKDLSRANKFYYKAGELLTAKQAIVISNNVY